MLENRYINMNRIHVFLRDNAFKMKASMLMLKSFSSPCFIHTLQLIIKNSLFSEKVVSVLIAKARQTINHFNHSSTACEKLKKPGRLKFISVNAKNLVTCARCWNKVIRNLPNAEKIRKIKNKCPELRG